ncbi:MAG: ribosome assembly cofactor RimP [Bacteroidetes bacterium]|nr:ribosome assembly cofactor RimP [Bacteroidota bacterium]
MIEKEIRKVVEEKLEGTDKFLVEILIRPTNRVMVIIDGDHGANIHDCQELTRFLLHHFDRNLDDYELVVSSPGIDRPLTMIRQYKANIGRTLTIILENREKMTGKLTAVSQNNIQIEVPKTKKTPAETRNLPFNQILEAKIIISFK